MHAESGWPGKDPLMPSIRFLSPSDTDLIVGYGRKFYDEGPWPTEYDKDTVRPMVAILAEQGVSLWAHVDGQPVGMLLIMLNPFVFNASCVNATEIAFYIDPEYRKSGLAAELIETAECALMLKGVTMFNMASLEAGTPEAAERLYKKLGFEKIETVFTKDLR